MGCVPIVEANELADLYSAFPVLVVKSVLSLDERSLEEAYLRLKPGARGLHSTELLHRPYWRRLFESTRTEALARLHLPADNGTRRRCWG